MKEKKAVPKVITQRPAAPAPYTLAPGDLLTTPAVAELLSCTARNVVRLIDAGYLPAMRVGPGRTAYRIHAADLKAFVTQHGHLEPAAVAEGGHLPAFTPRPVRLVTHRTEDGLTLVTLYKPPAGIENEDETAPVEQ